MKKIISALVFASPVFVFAQSSGSTQNLSDLFRVIGNVFSGLVPLLMGLAFVWFIWNMVKYIEAGADAKQRDAARDSIITTVIVFFAMVSIWGLVNLLVGTFNLSSQEVPEPTIPGVSR